MIVRTTTDLDAHNFLSSQDAALNVWHRRLGHLGYENTRKTTSITHGMVISNSSLAGEVYRPCIFEKSKRTVCSDFEGESLPKCISRHFQLTLILFYVVFIELYIFSRKCWTKEKERGEQRAQLHHDVYQGLGLGLTLLYLLGFCTFKDKCQVSKKLLYFLP